MLESLLQPALNYAENGYRIFPCHYPIFIKNSTPSCSCRANTCKVGKHPMIKNWTDEASDNPDTIKSWWDKYPYANIGLLTGAPNGFDVLDEDPKDGGDTALQERIAIYGAMPPTPTARTGSGGEHFLFRHTPGLKNNNHGKIAKGLDFRTTGGQIIAPPSMHASGNRYEWLTTSEDIAAPPQWLLDALQSNTTHHTSPKTTLEEWKTIAAGVTGGERHNAILKVAGLLLNTLESKHLAVTLTHAYNNFCCDVPKDPEEVNKILRYILNKKTKRLQ